MVRERGWKELVVCILTVRHSIGSRMICVTAKSVIALRCRV